MLKCPSCQARNAHGRRTCRRCGHALVGLSNSDPLPNPGEDGLALANAVNNEGGDAALRKAGPQDTPTHSAAAPTPATPANATQPQSKRAAAATPHLKLRNQRPEVPFTIENEDDDVFTSADRPEAFEVTSPAAPQDGSANPGAAAQVTYIPGKGIVDLNPEEAPPPPKSRPAKRTKRRRSKSAPRAVAVTTKSSHSAKPPPLPPQDATPNHGRITATHAAPAAAPAATLVSTPNDDDKALSNAAADQRDTREEIRAVSPADLLARQTPHSTAAGSSNPLQRAEAPRSEHPSTPPPLPPGVARDAAPALTFPVGASLDEDAAQEATLVSAAPVPRPVAKDNDMSEIARLGSLFIKEQPDVTPTNPFTLSEITDGDERQDDATPGATLIKLRKDGKAQARMQLAHSRLIIGREDGDVVLKDDPTVSPWHAQLHLDGDRAMLKDMNSLNGVYVRLSEPMILRDGDSILAGNQRFVFRDTWDPPNPTEETTKALGAEGYDDPSRLMLMRAGGQCVGVYFIGQALTIGRASGELVFAADEQMDDEHARIVRQDNGEHTLHDLNSGDGVFVAIRGEVSLNGEQCFQVGRTRFRLTLHG